MTARPLLVTGLAALAGSALFRAVLFERSDYVGHFIAGFGGTLLVLAFAVHLAGVSERARGLEALTFGVVILSIGFGAILESTVFRIAQFDPIDFLNQSLGAVLAGLAALASRPSPVSARWCAFGWSAVATASLVAGFKYAFA